MPSLKTMFAGDMIKNFPFAALAAGALLFSAQAANAGHIFFSPVDINGTVLETNAGFTDPILSVVTGQTVTFHTTISGETNGGFNFSFFPDAGSTLVIPDFVGDNPTDPTEINYSLTFLTPGFFDGSVRADIPPSSPDYMIPAGGMDDSRNFPFRLQVTPAVENTVPEPVSLALVGLGALGLVFTRRKASS